MLMLIARNSVFLKETNHGALPPSWRTLYELAQIRPQKLTEFIESGKINPTMMREDAIALRIRQTNAVQQTKPNTPRLRQELATLVNAAIVLGGGDCCLHHLNSIDDIRDIKPTPAEVSKAADWVKEKLRRKLS
jgi:hypothetical protein